MATTEPTLLDRNLLADCQLAADLLNQATELDQQAAKLIEKAKSLSEKAANCRKAADALDLPATANYRRNRFTKDGKIKAPRKRSRRKKSEPATSVEPAPELG
jgi:hypothetical protein